jgi:acetyl/propionyl-CoA carboxylase alpha subunit
MFNKVLVSNRGAVAARVLRALNAMNIPSVAVYSEADHHAPYLEMASQTFAIGPAPHEALSESEPHKKIETSILSYQ